MEAIKINKIIEKDGEISLKDLPVKKGQHVEMVILLKSSGKPKKRFMTARDLLNSDLIGMWKDRDIKDSVAYARQLREEAQTRRG
jgi:type III secretory pathway lipoprotein EscJ